MTMSNLVALLVILFVLDDFLEAALLDYLCMTHTNVQQQKWKINLKCNTGWHNATAREAFTGILLVDLGRPIDVTLLYNRHLVVVVSLSLQVNNGFTSQIQLRVDDDDDSKRIWMSSRLVLISL